MYDHFLYVITVICMFLGFQFLPRSSRLFPTYTLEYLWGLLLYIIIAAAIWQVKIIYLPLYLVCCGAGFAIIGTVLVSILVYMDPL